MPKGKLAKLAPTGVVFVTYSLLISGSKTSRQNAIEANNDSHDLELVHYPHGSRLRQLYDWLKHGDQDVLIVFDESHKAKNLQGDKGEPLLVLYTDLSPGKHVYTCSHTAHSRQQAVLTKSFLVWQTSNMQMAQKLRFRFALAGKNLLNDYLSICSDAIQVLDAGSVRTVVKD